jgi:two-component system cell cycle sensor histidine kinase/response regulator CckA
MSLLPWFTLVRSGRERSVFFRYGIAASSVGLSLLAGLWLRPFTYRSPNLFFYAAILISLLYGGLGAGIASTILSAVVVNYFFFPPYGRFSFDAVSIFNGFYFCLSFGVICWLIDAKWERAEAKRIESESRVRIFIEHAPAALAMFDREMRYLQASRRWRIDYGLGDRDLDGVSHYEIFPEIPARWKEIHRRALAGEVLGEEHDRFERADGSVQWIRWEARPWRDSEGRIGGIVIFADDVTERKQAADVRERLAAVVESSEDAIIAKRLDGTINAWNSGAEKVFGYSHAEAIGKPIQMLLPPEQAREESDILARIARGESVEHFETVRIRKDGIRIDVSVTISPIRDITGAIVSASKIARDITEDKRAERKLKEYERVVEGLDEKIMVLDREYRYVIANPAFLKYRDIERENIIGHTVPEIMGKQYFETVFQPRMDECFQGKVVQYEFKYEYPNIGARDIFASYFPIEGPDGIDRIAIILQDITERKRADQLLRESEKNYRTLFESMDEGFCTVEVLFDENDNAVDYRFLEVNPAFAKQTGIPDARGRRMREIAPQHEEHWFQIYGKIALTGEPARFESRAEQLSRWYDVHAFRVGEPQDRKVAIFFDDISERKEAEEAVKESERQFRSLGDSIPQLTWMANADGWIYWYNQRWYQYTGTTIGQMQGWGWQSVHDPVELPKVMERWKASIATSEPFDMVFPLRGADGVFRPFLTRVMPVKNAEGRVVQWFGTNTDISEQKRTEDALREYERVVEGLEEMILVVDRDFHYVLANRAFQDFRGMYGEQVVGRSVEQVVGRETFATHVKEKMEECFRGNVVEYEMNYDFPNRGRRDLHLSYFPIEGPKGVERIACVLQDITDHKRAEVALLKSEERFSKAFRNNPLAITISTEVEGRYLDVNDAFLNLLGYQRKDVIGSTAKELRFWSEPLDREEMLRHLKEEEKVAKHHTKYRTVKGEIREAEVWAESIELDGQRCILGITRDVTEMKKLEAQFRQAQKMEAVGRLAGGVAHDFNNVLGIVMGYSDIALGEIPTDTPVKKYLTEIKKASQRAALITRQLLAFSRQQVIFPKMIDLNDVVQNVTTMFLRLVGEDIEFEFRPGTAIGSIKADPGQIEQILMNLVVNARDAMPTGGKITIETGTSELDEHYTSRHAGAHEGKHVVLKVSDTGSGMDETTRSQIFEPFFTTKAPGKGTGLGLSTVYGIVKQSDGYISVYSEPGQGTTFKIYFPRLREKAEELGSHREEAEPPRGSETILVVEDDKILRGLAVKLLQEGGYHVIEAEDAENALKILSSAGVEVDLLLTDIVMPGKTGVELLAEAKKIRQNLRAVFMSGYAGDLVTQHGVLVQEHSFLEKPFTKRALLTKVYSVLHGKT